MAVAAIASFGVVGYAVASYHGLDFVTCWNAFLPNLLDVDVWLCRRRDSLPRQPVRSEA